MKKILYLLLACVLLLFLCSCDVELTKEYPKPVIVLPDDETASNVNGYKTETENSENASFDESSSETIANGKYVGNKSSKKYHTTDCRYAKNMKEENMVIFDTFEEVKAAGYSACSVCGN